MNAPVQAQEDIEVQDRLIAPPPGKKIRIALLLEVPAIIITMVMMLHVSLNAIMRTFFARPMNYTLEVTEYWYMPIIVFLGFIAAQLRGEHVKADFIFNLIPVVTRKYVLGVAFALITVVTFGLAWYGGVEAMKAFDVLRKAGISPIPSWPTYFLAPIAFGILTLQFLYASVQYFRGKDLAEASEMDDIEVEELMARGE